jgi:hypothetical protein
MRTASFTWHFWLGLIESPNDHKVWTRETRPALEYLRTL